MRPTSLGNPRRSRSRRRRVLMVNISLFGQKRMSLSSCSHSIRMRLNKATLSVRSITQTPVPHAIAAPAHWVLKCHPFRIRRLLSAWFRSATALRLTLHPKEALHNALSPLSEWRVLTADGSSDITSKFCSKVNILLI